MRYPIEISNVQIQTSATGIKLVGSITIDSTGQTFPVSSPEISYRDLWTNARKGLDDARDEGKRLWQRIKGWFS